MATPGHAIPSARRHTGAGQQHHPVRVDDAIEIPDLMRQTVFSAVMDGGLSQRHQRRRRTCHRVPGTVAASTDDVQFGAMRTTAIRPIYCLFLALLVAVGAVAGQALSTIVIGAQLIGAAHQSWTADALPGR